MNKGEDAVNKALVVGLALLSSACATAQVSPGALQDMPAEITMEGARLFPESITSDAAGNIYVGSNPGIVFRALRGSERAVPWIVPGAANGLATVFGVLADDARGLLWLCSNQMTPPPGAASVKAFALDDGRLVATYPFPADAGPALCNDITIDANGDVYASDTVGGRILKLPAGGRALEYWAASDHFMAIDGISFGPGGVLYANNIRRNTLLRVDRGADGSFAAAHVLETSAPLGGPDGLRPLGATQMLQSEGNAGTITVLTFPETGPVEVRVIASGIDYASSVTMVGGRAYFPEGKLRFMADPAADAGSFVIRSVEIAQ